MKTSLRLRCAGECRPAPRANRQAHTPRDLYTVEELERAIQEYLEENNKQPKPFVWAATVEEILAKVNRCKAILETEH
jgi:hypothetical protein